MNEENLEQIKILKEILKWVKIGGINKTRQIMENELSDSIKVTIYHLSDGRSSDDIEKALNKKASDVTIRNLWKKWSRCGIMELHPNYKKRYIKIFNIEDFGMEVPDISEKNKANTLSEDITKSMEVKNNG